MKKNKDSMRLGKGGRFKKLKKELMSKGYSEESSKKISAKIGMNKYGKLKMLKWAMSEREKNKAMKSLKRKKA